MKKWQNHPEGRKAEIDRGINADYIFEVFYRTAEKDPAAKGTFSGSIPPGGHAAPRRRQGLAYPPPLQEIPCSLKAIRLKVDLRFCATEKRRAKSAGS